MNAGAARDTGRQHLDVVIVGASPYERGRLAWRLDRSYLVVAGVGGSPADAARSLGAGPPAAAILVTDDLEEAARWRDHLRARWLGLGIVVVGGIDPARDPDGVLADGPVAVLPATASESALEWAVRTVADGGSAIGLDTSPRSVLDAPNGSGPQRGRLTAAALPQDLTEAEAVVLEAMARGLTNDEIAEELGISRHTVKTHVSHVTDKLGACNRTDAARLFLRGVPG